jgi:hypothetical protein
MTPLMLNKTWRQRRRCIILWGVLMAKPCAGTRQILFSSQQQPSVPKIETLDRMNNVPTRQRLIDAKDYEKSSYSQKPFVDDDWKYHPTYRLLEEQIDNDENTDDNQQDGDNDISDKNNDDDCITERNYLGQLINHMLTTTPEEWSVNEIILGCCLLSLALSSILVSLCCLYGCCAAYCCCCCEGKKRGSNKRRGWDDELDYQFTNDSSFSLV